MVFLPALKLAVGFGMSRLSPRFHLRRISFMFFRSASHNKQGVSEGETVQRASNCKQLPSARAFISWYVSLPFAIGRTGVCAEKSADASLLSRWMSAKYTFTLQSCVCRERSIDQWVVVERGNEIKLQSQQAVLSHLSHTMKYGNNELQLSILKIRCFL